ncbi:hypothetical protein MCOR27_005728 [Pyricularia oryzae]|uniref:Uncharacterized protein n=4 Tax=Pyricularia oryzae TaxID=318829 RepID=G4MKK6_PYRO7|nr:uncharacterized protein MGG_16525 [Pyricularia oryzae 70-15]ELQ33077.1 hypothetical protein OOU_Y34scaffold01005g103 [Pyricularia oryzae Y34]KAI6278239.1 hypothetical protein MCOR27_005728 [Pyricularia oryzae]EHA58389.1 hypothetical protein MGG_16525 [Pyricularia oryzae 70-15]KAI6323314.1 hypothetical protein MCOR30_007333 [Pyricularia oryzae]KAI6365840.1 hypothetical protein MCOR32_007643 [Pyricularia oryzae]
MSRDVEAGCIGLNTQEFKRGTAAKPSAFLLPPEQQVRIILITTSAQVCSFPGRQIGQEDKLRVYAEFFIVLCSFPGRPSN